WWPAMLGRSLAHRSSRAFQGRLRSQGPTTHIWETCKMSADTIFADNPLCRMLAIRYPICQAGMYQVAYASLAAAVSNAGGLGMIGSAYMPPARSTRTERWSRGRTRASQTT